MNLSQETLLYFNEPNEKLNNLYFYDENFIEYILLDNNAFLYLISKFYNNQLLILFCLSFFSTLYCCSMKQNVNNKNHKYILINQSENEPNDDSITVPGKIIKNDEKV